MNLAVRLSVAASLCMVLLYNTPILMGQESPHGKLELACENCHVTSSWKMLASPMKFNHDATRFSLKGLHVGLDCRKCHSSLKFKGTSSQCVDCHKDVHRGELSATCDRCHSPASWLVPDMAQRHNRTKFPLLGAHMTAPCEACHVNQQKNEYVGLTTDCYGCHRADYDATTAPPHRSSGFSTDCVQCHAATAVSWGGGFNHAQTSFPLTGAHVAVPCSQCHQGGRFQGTSMQCVSCHQADANNAMNPKHVPPSFSTECNSCHSTTAWKPSNFDHSKTQFPLTGAHPAVPCSQCHKNGVYLGTPTQCSSCHLQQYNAVLSPKHTQPSFSLDCTVCHTTAAWNPSTFAHNKTKFPLTGDHMQVPCASCHQNGVYAGTPTQCSSCHQGDFNNAVNPNHVAAGFPTDCTLCHSTTAWRPSSFDHSKTQFPLTGAHAAVLCTQCHQNNRYQGTPTQCVSCHQTDYNNVVSPKHVLPTFSTDCTGCHTTSAWKPSSFNHGTTRFPLTGAHVTTACSSCHINGVYAGMAMTCVSCHQQQYNATTNPNHVTSGFSTDCQSCHTTTAWQPATFDHSKTQFPLTGAHAAVACSQCHPNGRYQGTPLQCSGCHQADYAAVVTPKHTQPSFSLDCTLCHSTSVWKPSSFNHSTTRFTLTGAHVTAACASCHINGVYAGTPMTCVGCHQQQFNATTNPNHVTAGFPTDCQTCHNTTAWQPSTFDHSKTQFPLTGAHVAVACTQCHPNGRYQNTPTQCSGCHQTDYNNVVTPKHTQPSFSLDCTVCHTTTAWKPSTFNHSNTHFTLTGVHVTTPCASCHINGVYAGTPTTCVGCHQQNYNSTTNPNHAAAGFPTDCQTCHSTTAWSPSTWDHTTYFPIGAGSSHPPGRWTTCADCHTVPSNYKVFSCVTCHEHSQGNTDPRHTGVSGYTYESAACYRCHPRGGGGD